MNHENSENIPGEENAVHSRDRSEPGDGGKKRVEESVIILETSRLSTMRKIIRKEVADKEKNSIALTILCNQKREKFYRVLPGVQEILKYPSKGIGAKLLAAAKLLLSLQKFDTSIAVFDGEKQFRKTKLLLWLLNSRKRIAYDGRMRSFRLSLKTIPRLFRKDRKAVRISRGIEVLIFETDEIEILREVIEKTHQENVIPGAKVKVFCRESTARLLEGNPMVRGTIAYPDYSLSGWFLTTIKTIASRQNVIAGVLNGRKRFLLSKLVFCLCRNRHRLVFNGSLDCCFWNRHTYGQIIIQGLKAGVNSPFADNPRKVLILETAEPLTMRRIIRIAAEPRVVPDAKITVFCSEIRLEEYAGAVEEINQIRTYSNCSLTKKLGAALRATYTYPDVVVARFSGKREFRAMKFLFWMIRARDRIVFNESLDCFYLNRKTAGLLIKGGGPYLAGLPIGSLFRKIVRALLFLPRFTYLIAWRGYRKLVHKAA